MDYLLIGIMAVFALALLFIFRGALVWWTGINEVINEQKKTNELLAELLKQ